MRSTILRSSGLNTERRTSSDQTKAANNRLPAGACDSHVHVYGPFAEFPISTAPSFQPPLAPLITLENLWSRFGVERGVFVQGSAYGQDHRALLAAIGHAPVERRGVALVGPTTSDEVLEQFHTSGVCGARLNFVRHIGDGFNEALCWQVVQRIEPLGWHLELHIDATDLEHLQNFVDKSPVRIVIDHMGRIDAALGLDQAPFQALLNLVSRPHCWVKLSGADRLARQESLETTISFARALIEAAPDRVVWGTDWPHVNRDQPHSDEALFGLLAEFAPDHLGRSRLLVGNPACLYGFNADPNKR